MKVRVYQLARELRVENDALVAVIQAVGGDVKNHMSSVDEGIVQQVRERVAQEKSGSKRDPNRRVSRAVAATTSTPTPTPTTTAPSPPETPRPSIPEAPATPPAPRVPTPAPAAKAPKPARVEPPQAEKKQPPVSPPAKERPAAKSGNTWSGSNRGSNRPSSAPAGRPPENRPPARSGGGRGPSRPVPTPQDTGDAPLGPSRTPHVGQSRGTRGFGSNAAVRSLGSRQERKKKRKGGRQVDVQAVRQNVRKTLTALDGRSKSRRRRRGGAAEDTDQAVLPLKIHEYATVGELASVLEAKPTEVIAACLQLGIIANINRQLEKEEITLIMDEFGHEPEFESEYATETVLEEINDDAGDHELVTRAPIVTVMGHVDHGKTTLLDFIRNSQVTESESGGITQHIGAYRVELPKRTIAFLDTPGHEAFTAMRARGAKITDAVVLVVAANDQVRPQTIEAINHAKAAGVPLIVAINKVDVNGANPDNIRSGLADAGVQVESWGGKVVDVEISAKHGTNVDKLLEMIVLESELLELTAAPSRTARGAIIESRRDSGKGIVATVLVQDGTLRIGDAFVCGAQFGRVRAMVDEHGTRLAEAGPSTPVEVLGWSGVPFAGESFVIMSDEARAREIAAHRSQITRAHEHRLMGQKTSLYTLQERIQAGALAELNVIVKADVAGSVEVLRDTLEKIAHEEVQVKVIHMGVGLISEADVNLAMASGAIIVGFHTRPDNRAQQLAINEGVDIRLYQVIYEVESEIKAAMGGMLSPEEIVEVKGSAEVREVFDISKVGQIAGCMVVSGVIGRNDRAKVYRANDVVFDGTLASLKRHKDDAKEVASGFECGIGLEGFTSLEAGDIIEAYGVSEKARTVE